MQHEGARDRPEIRLNRRAFAAAIAAVTATT